MLLPALNQARERGRSASCLNNLSQIIKAQTLYSSDNNGFMVGYLNKGGNKTWGRILYTEKYLPHWKNLSCPANTAPKTAANFNLVGDGWDYVTYGVYAGNLSADGWDYAIRVKQLLGNYTIGAAYEASGLTYAVRRLKNASAVPLVIDNAHAYLKAYAIDCLLTAVLFCFVGYFNGCGRTAFVMVQGVVGAFCVRIPVVFLMSHLEYVTLFHIGLGTPISSVAQIILCVIAFQALPPKTVRC